MQSNFIIEFLWNFALGFGLPPTPPSSLSSDDSEDNHSAEMHTIPSSPVSSLSSLSPSNNSQQAQLAQNGATKNSHSVSNGSPNSSRGYNAPSSRQPIHTPLISNQPVRMTFCSFHWLFVFIDILHFTGKI